MSTFWFKSETMRCISVWLSSPVWWCRSFFYTCGAKGTRNSLELFFKVAEHSLSNTSPHRFGPNDRHFSASRTETKDVSAATHCTRCSLTSSRLWSRTDSAGKTWNTSTFLLLSHARSMSLTVLTLSVANGLTMHHPSLSSEFWSACDC